MASKQNILLHLDGINACESKEYEHALGLFKRISEPSAPIYFNMGCCYLRLRDNHSALQMFEKCVAKDKYLAIGHFQLAVAQTLCGDRQLAIASFMEAFKALRGNAFINYKQLNNSSKVYAFDINFNIALLHFFSGGSSQALSYLRAASSNVNGDSSKRSLVNDAATNLESGNWDYFGQSPEDRLRNLQENCFFHPSKAKLEGIQAPTKFMDSAKVVSAAKDEYSFVGFVGAKSNPVSQLPSHQSHSTTPNKRPSPPSAPPPPVPHVPPPRLPPEIPQPLRSLPSPTPVKPSNNNNRSASPAASPSRPPPPSIPAPKPNKPSEENADVRTIHTNVMDDFKKSLDSNLKGGPNLLEHNENAFHKPTYTKYRKPSPTQTKIELDCQLTLFVDGEPTYQQMIGKISEHLYHISSDLRNLVLEGNVSLSCDNPQSATAQIDEGTWQDTWSEINKIRPCAARFILKEGHGEKPMLSPKPKSPYKRSPVRSPESSPNHFVQQYRNTTESQVEDEEVYADHMVLSVHSTG